MRGKAMNQPTNDKMPGCGHVTDLAEAVKYSGICACEWIAINTMFPHCTVLHILPTGIVEHERIDEDNKAGMGAVIESYDLDGKRRDIQ